VTASGILISYTVSAIVEPKRKLLEVEILF
jgi:hypothetical protein